MLDSLAAWHDALVRDERDVQLELSNLKLVFMPRQALLKKLDPSGQPTISKLKETLGLYVREYQRLVVQERVTSYMDIKETLKHQC